MSVIAKHINPKFQHLFQDRFCFTPNEYELLLSYMQFQHIHKKDFYLRPGEICRTKAYLNKGCTRNFVVDERGHERILFFAFEDWWLGDFDSYYTQKPGTNYVQAIEDCELLVISKENFAMLEERIPKLKQWYTYKVTRSASASLKRMEEIRTLTPKERYLNLIEQHPHIFQRIPLQYIASFLNIEPQSLSRMRKRLAEER
ncbi:MAG: Crp/Fnr family transcriptional regulator [Ignavibacteria bacterium]|nr:Crp/Fnr family transcriptional regulator [Ignavibacteria bacterium]